MSNPHTDDCECLGCTGSCNGKALAKCVADWEHNGEWMGMPCNCPIKADGTCISRCYCVGSAHLFTKANGNSVQSCDCNLAIDAMDDLDDVEVDEGNFENPLPQLCERGRLLKLLYIGAGWDFEPIDRNLATHYHYYDAMPRLRHYTPKQYGFPIQKNFVDGIIRLLRKRGFNLEKQYRNVLYFDNPITQQTVRYEYNHRWNGKSADDFEDDGQWSLFIRGYKPSLEKWGEFNGEIRQFEFYVDEWGELANITFDYIFTTYWCSVEYDELKYNFIVPITDANADCVAEFGLLPPILQRQ